MRKLDSFAKKQSEKFAQILAPHKETYARAIAGSMTQSMRHLLDSVAQQNAKFAVFLPKVEEPNLEFSSNPLAEILSMEPKLADTQLTSPTFQTVIVDGLKEMDQSHFGVLSQIALNTSWGSKEWMLFWLTWVAAVAGIAAAVASVVALFR